MRKALIIGINDYPNAALRGCVNDAEAMAKILSTHEDGKPNFDVRLLTAPSETITRPILRESLEALYAGDPEIALLFFSGHGHIKTTGGYVVTPDFTRYDEGISMNDIFELANLSKAANKVIMLDCCYSGAFAAPTITNAAGHLTEGVSVLTACRATEEATEVNGMGVFTSLVVNALQGGAADLRGHITPGSVYAYVDQALGPWDHRPIFKTNVTQFCSLRESKPRVPAEILRKLIVHFPEPNAQFALDPSFEDTTTKPDATNVAIFKELQKLQSVGLVVPVGEEHMYYAAMNSKSCKLSSLGQHYWRLAKANRI